MERYKLKNRKGVADSPTIEVIRTRAERKLNDGRKVNTNAELSEVFTWAKQPEGHDYWEDMDLLFQVDNPMVNATIERAWLLSYKFTNAHDDNTYIVIRAGNEFFFFAEGGSETYTNDGYCPDSLLKSVCADLNMTLVGEN